MATSGLKQSFESLAALCKSGRFQEALPGAQTLAETHPDHFAVQQLYGAILKELDHLEAASQAFERAVTLKHDDAGAHFNFAVLCQKRRQFEAAVLHYTRAIALKPDHAAALNNLGNTYRSLADHQQARLAFERALKIRPDYVGCWCNLAGLFSETGQYPEAETACLAALKLDPDSADATALLLRIRARLCDFDGVRALAPNVEHLGLTGKAVPPFDLLSMEDAPARQKLRAKAWAAQNYGHISATTLPAHIKRPKRLRVGYFSSDFHDHATLRLMSGVLRCHDRHRFEIFAYGFGREMSGALFEEMADSVDGFHAIQNLSEEAATELARSHDLDIAVDVNGFTKHARSELFAKRVAPVQISYLGFPGTMGLRGIDYIVADRVLIPEALRQHYVEKVIYLPASYQPNDRQRPISGIPVSRAQMGLPESATVLCCFNACHKIGETEFDIWMRLLRRDSSRVLWLMRQHAVAMKNLRQHAAKKGVSSEQIVFAEPLPNAEHLARHRLADLFVDTFHYNAHTTGSDALWAGVPMVTNQGGQFSARVAASLLSAAGLPELITETADGYEALIQQLLTDKSRLTELRMRVEATCPSSDLFNTESYTRHLEEAFEEADSLIRAGREPRDISVLS
ncbi:MAG: tetratricopeptide repeat protein [Pseudomonadota bacterium]